MVQEIEVYYNQYGTYFPTEEYKPELHGEPVFTGKIYRIVDDEDVQIDLEVYTQELMKVLGNAFAINHKTDLGYIGDMTALHKKSGYRLGKCTKAINGKRFENCVRKCYQEVCERAKNYQNFLEENKGMEIKVGTFNADGSFTQESSVII